MIQVVVAKSPNIFISRGNEKKIFQCPNCSTYNHFYTSGGSNCRSCRQILPNVYALMENELFRIKWHAGVYK